MHRPPSSDPIACLTFSGWKARKLTARDLTRNEDRPARRAGGQKAQTRDEEETRCRSLRRSVHAQRGGRIKRRRRKEVVLPASEPNQRHTRERRQSSFTCRIWGNLASEQRSSSSRDSSCSLSLRNSKTREGWRHRTRSVARRGAHASHNNFSAAAERGADALILRTPRVTA